MDLLPLLELLGAALQSIPSARNPLTLRLILAESCDVVVEFLERGNGPRGFSLNTAQVERLISAARDFKLSEEERRGLGTNEGDALIQVAEMLRECIDRLRDGELGPSEASTLINALDRTRALLRRS